MIATASAPQPISGVSAGRETVIEEVYPSIAASGFGRFLGRLMNCIPLRINGILLSQLLFAPLVAPLALIGYLQFKVTGRVYVLTNRSVRVRAVLGQRLYQSVPLTDIEDIAIRQQPGQQFYQAGDLELFNARGELLLTFAGVPRPERFRKVILDAREARIRSDRSLEIIRSRG